MLVRLASRETVNKMSSSRMPSDDDCPYIYFRVPEMQKIPGYYTNRQRNHDESRREDLVRKLL